MKKTYEKASILKASQLQAIAAGSILSNPI